MKSAKTAGARHSGARQTLGRLLRGLRLRNDWTLKEMSKRTGIPLSTLAKVEHDRLTLTYDKLQLLSERLKIPMSELFAEPGQGREPSVTARRSIGRIDRAVRVNTRNYDYYYLCAELRRKRMMLEAGESIYIDSNMGHAYVATEGCEEATVLGVCSSADEGLMESLLELHGDEDVEPTAPPDTGRLSSVTRNETQESVLSAARMSRLFGAAILIAFLVGAGPALPQAAAPAAEPFATAESARIESFAWLAGCWSMPLPDGVVEEFWLPPAGGAMLGLSRTIRAGRMQAFEYLALREMNGTLAYVAVPSRQRETVFALVRHKSTALVFENSAHDYPQRIIYRKTSQGIAARIEGVVKGELRGSDYDYKPCNSPQAPPSSEGGRN